MEPVRACVCHHRRGCSFDFLLKYAPFNRSLNHFERVIYSLSLIGLSNANNDNSTNVQLIYTINCDHDINNKIYR